MVKNASTKLVREKMGGESYEYYPLGQYIVVAPGVCGGRPTFKNTRIDVRHALEGSNPLENTLKILTHSSQKHPQIRRAGGRPPQRHYANFAMVFTYHHNSGVLANKNRPVLASTCRSW